MASKHTKWFNGREYRLHLMCVHTLPVFGCASCIAQAEVSAYTFPPPKRHGVPPISRGDQGPTREAVAQAYDKLTKKLKTSSTFRLTLKPKT